MEEIDDDAFILCELSLINIKSQEKLSRLTKILIIFTIVLVFFTLVLVYYTMILAFKGG